MGWSKVTSHLGQKQVTSNATEAEERISESVDSVTQEDWTKYCHQVDTESANLIINEIIAEDIQDPIVVNFEDESDSDSENEESDDVEIYKN